MNTTELTNRELADELLRWATNRDRCSEKPKRKGRPLDSTLLREAARRLIGEAIEWDHQEW